MPPTLVDTNAVVKLLFELAQSNLDRQRGALEAAAIALTDIYTRLNELDERLRLLEAK